MKRIFIGLAILLAIGTIGSFVGLRAQRFQGFPILTGGRLFTAIEEENHGGPGELLIRGAVRIGDPDPVMDMHLEVYLTVSIEGGEIIHDELLGEIDVPRTLAHRNFNYVRSLNLEPGTYRVKLRADNVFMDAEGNPGRIDAAGHSTLYTVN